MRKGTTPTFTLTVEGVDLTLASSVYVTFAGNDQKEILTKTGADIDVDEHSISVYLTQAETLAFPAQVCIQLNWTYVEDGTTKRACTEIETVTFNPNLINREL